MLSTTTTPPQKNHSVHTTARYHPSSSEHPNKPCYYHRTKKPSYYHRTKKPSYNSQRQRRRRRKKKIRWQRQQQNKNPKRGNVFKTKKMAKNSSSSVLATNQKPSYRSMVTQSTNKTSYPPSQPSTNALSTLEFPHLSFVTLNPASKPYVPTKEKIVQVETKKENLTAPKNTIISDLDMLLQNISLEKLVDMKEMIKLHNLFIESLKNMDISESAFVEYCCLKLIQ